jgi:flagellar hook assembly protein FlgD
VVTIYDAEGRLVKALLDEVVPAGTTAINWDGRNEAGSTVTSGVYFYRLTAGKFSASRKMLLLK